MSESEQVLDESPENGDPMNRVVAAKPDPSHTPAFSDQMTTAETTKPVDGDQGAIARLRALGIDVNQLAVQPLPAGMWDLIAGIVAHIRWKPRRWYAAASLYGRFIAHLQAGGTVAELQERFGDGPALASLLAHAELRETVLAAGLPGPLNRWLGEVVRHTKLRRTETLDVVSRLIGQIQEELSKGGSPAEIMESLGESRPVGRRLHRDMLRQRPWWWHTLRWGCRGALALFATVLVATSGLLYRFHAVRSVEAVDVLEKLDASARAIPEEDRAWPLYAAGLEQLEFPADQAKNPAQWHAVLEACSAGPQNPAWAQASAFLAKNAGAVDLFIRGAQKPRLGYVRRDPANNGWLQKLLQGNVEQTYGKSTRRSEIRLPELTATHYMQSILTGTAQSAASAGDWPRAIRALTAVGSVSRQIWEAEEFEVSRLNALGAFNRAVAALGNVLGAGADSATDADLLWVVQEFQAWNPDVMRELAASMRKSRREFLLEMYSADGRFTKQGLEELCQVKIDSPHLKWFADTLGETWRTRDVWKKLAFQLLGPCLVPLVAGREEMLKKADELDDLEEADRQVLAGPEQNAGKYEQELDRLQLSRALQVRYLPLVVPHQSAWFKTALEGRWKQATERDAVLIVVAAELFRRRHGTWPDSVAAVVPEFLKSVPVDPYDGKPLRLAIIDGRPAVYSAGLDRQDNTAEIPADKLREISDRDWQLFPPLKPKRETEGGP